MVKSIDLSRNGDIRNAVEMKVQLEQAVTEEERQKIANSDLFMVAEIDGKTIFYHEAVWAKFNGKPIPTGYLVYHRDGDPMNNEPDNLDLIEENRDYGDLHEKTNRVFHEENFMTNREFIRDNFEDVYEVLF